MGSRDGCRDAPIFRVAASTTPRSHADLIGLERAIHSLRCHSETLAQATESDSAQPNQIHELRAAAASEKLANQILRANLLRSSLRRL